MTNVTKFDILCPLCAAKWGTADVHWGQTTDASHFTRKDGTKPIQNGTKAIEPCPECDVPFSVLQVAMEVAHAHMREEQLKKAMSSLPPTGTSQ